METQIKNLFARSPTLDTVLMIEKTIKENSGEFNRTELWKKLPRKVMWQTYLIVLDYLMSSGKIILDKEGKILWTYNPQRIAQAFKKGLIIK